MNTNLLHTAQGALRGVQQVCIHTLHFHEKELNTTEQAMLDAKAETFSVKGGDE